MLQWRGRPLDEVGYVLIGALALTLGTGAIYLNWQQAQRTSLQASQTRQAVGTIRQLLVVLYRGETGQRGYLLTQQQNYLDPYEKAAAQMPEILNYLHLVGEQQPAVRDSVLEIDKLARAKMGELQTAVELVKEGDPGAADLLMRSNFGKQTMDQLVEKLEELEQRVFVSEEQFSTELTEQMRQTAALTVICCVALFALFAIENHRVTNRRRAAEKASEVKSAFLASMSHELRTPLNVIIGYTQMQQEEALESGRMSDLVDLQRIESAGKHLLVLINGVLELSKIEAGRLEVNPSEFGVDELVREVMGLVEPLAKKQGNRLVVEVAPEAGRMFSDVTRIKQGLLNLASNAAKFTENGEIRLRVSRVRRQSRDWVEFAVRDTGPGIRLDDLARLFEPFSQLEVKQPKQGAKHEGTGLGLAITRRLSRLLGGDVAVESELGKGSTFTMMLPVEVTPGYFASKAVSGTRRRTAVVVVGGPVAAGQMQEELGRHGLEAVAVSGEAALQTIREERPGVVAVDPLAEGMDIWEVVAGMKADAGAAGIPVVLLAGRDGDQGLAAEEVLTTPVSGEALAAAILRHGSGEPSEAILLVGPGGKKLGAMIAKMGWRALEAATGEEGLRQFSEERPGMVMVDLLMEGMDGFGFLAELRQRPDGRETPVVAVVTGALTGAERERLRTLAAAAMQRGAFRVTGALERTAMLASRRMR
jgi:signal transduction histidine kinase/CheY-like chemotaxis protein